MKSEKALTLLKKINKKDTFIILGVIVACIIYSIFTYSNILINKRIIFDLRPKLYTTLFFSCCILITVIIVSLTLYMLKKKKVSIHKLFMVFAIILGTIYLFLSPVSSGSDELAHFYRSYEITQGHFATPKTSDSLGFGSTMPKSLSSVCETESTDGTIKYTQIAGKLTKKLDKNETIEYKNIYENISLYSPLQYIPYSIGIIIGKLLNLSPYLIWLLGRITGFIFWIIISVTAIKLMPFKKEFFAILLLLPTSLITATSISGDMMINCVTVLFIAKVVNLFANKKEINKKDYFILLGLSITISLCKIVYFPIILLLFILPKSIHKSKGKYYSTIFSILILSILIGGMWLVISSGYLDTLGSQKDWILSHPISYGIVLVRTFLNSFNDLFLQIFLGSYLIHNRLHISLFASWILAFVVFINLFNKENEVRFNLKSKIISGMAMTLVIILTCTALYVQWTVMQTGTVGTPEIYGLQGRYFLPVIMIAPILFHKKRINMKFNSSMVAFLIVQAMVYIEMVYIFLI